MDLFDHQRDQTLKQSAPLAARMRPRTLDEFIGQGHIVGPGRLLRRAIQADQLSSLIFFGPPGTGKTTLARIIANTTNAHFISLNAVLSGVKDIREAIAKAQDQLGMFGRRTILFIDEVHRFNKAQQDALLPHVENGTVILIGATTENPYFEVNKALVSRSRIFQLNPLDDVAVEQIVLQALQDEERGYGHLAVDLQADALAHLVNVANGDARAALNALELAVETTTPDANSRITITTAIAEESIQRRAVLYDRDGDAHFDTISAFIKSLRGSDPDAALYWLARMLYAGEEPRFIFRRMLVFAGEDVGLADPQALVVVTAAAQAFDYVGLPEGRYHLSQACLYLATCPKSNTTISFFDALQTVEQESHSDVPDHLKDANRDSADLGHGINYLYPHSYRDHWVAQQYLPTSLQGKVFYNPSDQGYEAGLQTTVQRRREAQLAAMLEPGLDERFSGGPSRGPDTHNRWLQRTISNAGAHLAQLRDRVFALAEVERHHLILDLNAGSGLLTWEAVRRTPGGGVWSLAASPAQAEALQQQAANLDTLVQPQILHGSPEQLPDLLRAHSAEAFHFDCLLGRNALMATADKTALLNILRLLLHGRLVIAETIPRETQRLYQLLGKEALPPDLFARLLAAEEAIYQNESDPMVNWGEEDLEAAAAAAGFTNIFQRGETQVTQTRLTSGHIERWFASSGGNSRPTYAQHLARQLNQTEIDSVQAAMRQRLQNQVVSWHSRIVYLVAETHPQL